MSPAPDTGRTVEEMQAEIRRQIASLSPEQRAIAERLAEVVEPFINDRTVADILRAENARIHDELDVCEVKLSGSEARVRILHEHMDCWRNKAKAAEAEAAHLRTENANLRDRVREAEGAAEGIQSYPSTFDEALAYIRPPSGTDSMAPVTLNAGMLRCCVSAILMRVGDRALAAKAAPLPDTDTGGKS